MYSLSDDLPRLADLNGYDALAALWLVFCWLGIGWWIEKGPIAARGAGALMVQRRIEWMREMARRDPRILDGNLLTGLQNGASFFASAALIGLGGILAMLGQAEQLAHVAHALPLSGPVSPDGLRLRLIPPLIFIAYTFFKFAWAQRLFGYCSVLIGATPAWNDARETEILAAADRAGKVNALAARSFNRALRSLYFTLGSLAWLVGPLALFVSVTAVSWMIHRREFRSDSRAAIAGE